MRLRNDSTALDKLQNSGLVINPEEYPIKLDDKSIVEIGMGKGEMIVELARTNPDKKYYGLEKYPTPASKLINKCKELKLNNLKIIIDDALNLPSIFEGKCNTLWLTFSDPWPKKKHVKRRLTYKDYLNLYKNILDDTSVLKQKTDNDKLYDFSLNSFKDNQWEIIAHGTDFHNSIYSKGNVMTGYEKKWSDSGKNINFIFVKKPKEQF
ncbi:tRNA (guanosine(46)-N7)-methyltransferase TrmB [Mycoplasma sp. Mirounga ES2805-ORL]|uniref:tRNA (guanosine(46)-N7)-methyltransferase TrmB n=1 Tax=Mycoplasma sp. Mirounga ES2805-ORL TaxID=754514 RepID=UPI00197BC38C|nr:tRNA (guanosine(46)-N7)-methyltransferase TrmB [Mycoplasma sp. Mirounga ES2805-ORL]QSF13478.1 tRNA (guanosine(46)-N7)-methyltransferase TrmB [Mycoplasma sp. Mirounga ES2805-ORL]